MKTTSRPIEEIQNEIVSDFEFLEDWSDRYTYIMEMGRSLAPYPDEWRTEDALVQGCQSRVWLHAGVENGAVVFSGDSDAMITRGLLAMLVRVFSGQPPEAIESAELRFLGELGLLRNLSPTRASGLAAMIERMKREARAIRLTSESS